MAGLALVYKRIEGFFQVLHFVFVALVVLPADAAWGKELSLSLWTRIVGGVMVAGERFATIPLADILILVGTAVFYQVVGLLVFLVQEGVAQDGGLPAHCQTAPLGANAEREYHSRAFPR